MINFLCAIYTSVKSKYAPLKKKSREKNKGFNRNYKKIIAMESKRKKKESETKLK